MHSVSFLGDDTLLSSAWNAIGDYYYERQKYQNALTYYSQGQHNSSLLDCLYVLEDFDRMQKLSESLPESHPLLQVGFLCNVYSSCILMHTYVHEFVIKVTNH